MDFDPLDPKTEGMRLVIPAGTDWAVGFPVLALNGEQVSLEGWSARVEVRTPPKVGRLRGTLLFTWSQGASPSPSEGSLDLLNGLVILRVGHAQSAGWEWRLGVYDLALTDPSQRRARPVSGEVVVSPEVTRSSA